MPLDYYQVLGITKKADEAEIKRAYKKKALETHPDKHKNSPEAEAAFKEVGEAYSVLGDPQKRRIYDASLNAESPKPQQPPKPSFPTAQRPQTYTRPQETPPKPARQEPSFASPQRPSPLFSQARPQTKPNVFAGFFEKEEDFFRPTHLEDDDIFMPFVARTSLDRLFAAMHTARQQPTHQRSTTPEHTFAKKETAPKPNRPEIHVAYIFVQAPSRVDLANFIAQTILLNALMIDLLTNRSLQNQQQEHFSHRARR